MSQNLAWVKEPFKAQDNRQMDFNVTVQKINMISDSILSNFGIISKKNSDSYLKRLLCPFPTTYLCEGEFSSHACNRLSRSK